MVFRAAFSAFLLCAVLSASDTGAAERPDSGSDSRTAAAIVNIPVSGRAAVAGAPDASAGDILGRVRNANEQLYNDLESFVCNEQMTRYKGTLSGDKAHQIDTVTARVSFENGTERYTNIRQNKQPRPNISGVTGAWSEGEFGTLLRQTQMLLGTQPVTLLRESDLNGTRTVVYVFEVAEQDSPWDLEVGGEHYRVPFRTEVSVAQDSGQILEIERVSTDMAPETHISEMRWRVSLAPVELNGRTWLLPKNGEYAVLYEESGRREWNLLSFSDYHRYGSEVAVRFDEAK
jgi:hypothetical protein